jgi:site-specific DNA-adenine methylase
VSGLRPFFPYYGSKWRAARAYPPPLHRQIVEPFAGSAGYALRYRSREAVYVRYSEVTA